MSKIITFGVFDFFHLGHLRLFEQCKQYADYLIVAVQDDKSILKWKPNSRVLYTLDERVEIISSLKLVNKVVVYSDLSISFLKKIDFDILGLGEDHKGKRFDDLTEWCRVNNKNVVRLTRTPNISSTEVKHKFAISK